VDTGTPSQDLGHPHEAGPVRAPARDPAASWAEGTGRPAVRDRGPSKAMASGRSAPERPGGAQAGELSRAPSQEVVRSLTDEHVLRALTRHRRLTRAELAVEVGISKPTAGESVRRLVERGLVVDTGERTQGGRGRGRVGSYYALAPAVGVALAVTIAPEGVVAECLNVYGDSVASVTRQAEASRVGAVLAEVAGALCQEVRVADVVPEPAVGAGPAGAARGAVERPIRLAVVSAADPVDRVTGRLVQLPDSPFLVGTLDPVAILGAYVDGPVVVDNDVNWAAAAEDQRDFAYLYLGEGLGAAIVDDGAIRRGSTGLTGEISHLLTIGPEARAIPFIELFGELGLRRPGSTAIDVERLKESSTVVRETIGTAVSGVIAAVIALADPKEIVVGGSWGPFLISEIRSATARMPRQVPVRAAAVTGSPAWAGVRAEALRRLRASVTADR
jgi:predicted NBD/HSP70 family sugar kinase